MNLMFEIIGCLILSWIILALLYFVLWLATNEDEDGVTLAIFIMVIGIVATIFYFATINDDTRILSVQEYIQEESNEQSRID